MSSLSDALFHGVLFDEDAPEAEELRQLAPRGAGPAGALAALAAAVAAVALAPWRLALHAAAAAAALLLRALTALGAPPLGYIPQAKLAELTAILSHMHERDEIGRASCRERV